MKKRVFDNVIGHGDEKLATSGKPPVVMLLSRNPYVEQSGRSLVLRQRISQLSREHAPILVVVGKADADGERRGIKFVPMASPDALLTNGWRLRSKPRQTWLYLSEPARRRVSEIIEAAGARLVYVDMLRLAPLVTGLPRNVAIILDYDDLLSRRYGLAARSAEDYDLFGFLSKDRRLLSLAGRTFARALLRSEARRCAAYELELLGRVDLALLTSPKEAVSLREAADAGMITSPPPIVAIPPVVEPGRSELPRQTGRRLIFLGNLRYAENMVMLRSLAEAIVELRAQGDLLEDAELEIIGDHAPDIPGSFAHLPFKFAGRVPDLSILAGQGIFLAPVTSGSGIKLKILDGMGLGCPVVTTPKGNEGLSARPNRDLIVASDPPSVLRAALKLRDRPALRAMLARRALAYLRRSHSNDLVNTLSDAVREAAGRAAKRSVRCQDVRATSAQADR